jgi:hypothetical protein
VDSTGSRQGQVASFSEYVNEPLCSAKDGNAFSIRLPIWVLLNAVSACGQYTVSGPCLQEWCVRPLVT